LGGYAHFRRDMLLYNSDGQDSAAVAKLLKELEQSNPVSRGLLLPHGESLPLAGVKRALGFLPSWMEAFAARSAKVRALLAEGFLSDFGAREPYQALLSGLDVHGQLIGRSAVHQSPYLWSKTMLPGYILTIWGTAWRWRTRSRAGSRSSIITSSRPFARSLSI